MSGTKVIVFDLTPFVSLSKRHIQAKRDSNLWMCFNRDALIKDYITLALCAPNLDESIGVFMERLPAYGLMSANPLDDLLIELEEFACLLFTWATKIQSDLEPLAILTSQHHNGRLIITQRGS